MQYEIALFLPVVQVCATQSYVVHISSAKLLSSSYSIVLLLLTPYYLLLATYSSVPLLLTVHVHAQREFTACFTLHLPYPFQAHTSCRPRCHILPFRPPLDFPAHSHAAFHASPCIAGRRSPIICLRVAHGDEAHTKADEADDARNDADEAYISADEVHDVDGEAHTAAPIEVDGDATHAARTSSEAIIGSAGSEGDVAVKVQDPQGL